MYEFGVFLLQIFEKLKANTVVKALFLKAFVLSFVMFVLPSLIVYLFFAVRSLMLGFIWEITEPLINAVIPTDISYQFTKFGAYLANHMQIIECFLIILSASITAFVIRFTRK